MVLVILVFLGIMVLGIFSMEKSSRLERYFNKIFNFIEDILKIASNLITEILGLN